MTAEVSPQAIRRLFAAAVTLGAFLLFMIQPLAAWLALAEPGGGEPAWTIALLIYQAALLAGCAYARAIRKWPPLLQAALQFILLLLALLWVPAALHLAAVPVSQLDSAWRGPASLALAIGPLAVVLAAQAPLLQRWLLLRQAGAHPFPMLAFAQIGGLAGLLAYMLLAPMLGAAMAWPWLGGYVVLVGLSGGAAATLPKRRRRFVANLPVALAPSLALRLEWLVLAGLPFALMLATAVRLGSTGSPMPPPWLMPLGVYLLSLPVAFARDRRTANAVGGAAAAVMVIAGSLAFPAAMPIATVPLLGLVLLFAVCVSLHAEMHRRRPDPAHLGIFHFILAAGALLGGVIAALVLPLLGGVGYPLLVLVAAALVRHRSLALFTPLWQNKAWRQWLAVWLPAAGLMLSLVCAGLFDPLVSYGGRLAAGLAVGALAFATLGRRWLFVSLLGLTMLAFGGWKIVGSALFGG